MGPLDGRVALITGTSRGIGRTLAIALAARGARVVVTARSEVPGKVPGTIHETARCIAEAGGECLAVRCDLEQEADIRALVAASLERFGATGGRVLAADAETAVDLSILAETGRDRPLLLAGSAGLATALARRESCVMTGRPAGLRRPLLVIAGAGTLHSLKYPSSPAGVSSTSIRNCSELISNECTIPRGAKSTLPGVPLIFWPPTVMVISPSTT